METNKVNFDHLSDNAHGAGGGMPELNELWGSTFSLKEWLFINRGSLSNPVPYIASRADVCDGKDMIRAFTDTQRLMAFVEENKLTKPNDDAILLSVPTQNIIPWLSGFISYNVYGIWFNSDIKSHGYYSPLAQLKPIKDHLDKYWRPH